MLFSVHVISCQSTRMCRIAPRAGRPPPPPPAAPSATKPTPWVFDVQCSTGAAYCATKHIKRHCFGKTLPGSYSSWTQAKVACLAKGKACLGVYDNGCDKKGGVTLCDSSKINIGTLTTSSTSCVFQPPAPPAAPILEWLFDSKCKTKTASCATKHVRKHCSGRTLGCGSPASTYATWKDAKIACLAYGKACYGVYDNGCKKGGNYRLCDSSKVTTSTLTNSYSSCVFQRPLALPGPDKPTGT